MNIASAKDIAHHIYQALEAAEYPEFAEKFGPVESLRTDYVVQAGPARVAIGPDTQYADGICWALYTGDEEYGYREPYAQGGWASADQATADREIAEIIKALDALST